MKELQILGGHFLSASSEDSGTRDVMFYTGFPVLRALGNGRAAHLSFSMKPGDIDLSILNSGTSPFVMDHVEDIGHTLGRVEKAWLDGTARATIRFSDRDEVQGYINDIKGKSLGSVSMGVRFTADPIKADPVEKGIPHFLVVKWQPYHIALVSRGADPNAQFLSGCRVELSAELMNELSEPTGAASEAENSEAKTRLALAIKARRFRVLGR